MEYLVLALVGIVLLGGLVALGAGHARWSWGTVIAGFLVLLTASGYLYLVTRLAARERAWATSVTRYQTDLARVRDALQPDRRGVLGPIPAEVSLEVLRAERDRWRRAYDKARDWQGRIWSGASFSPPREARGGGLVELPPDGNAADDPPFPAGAVVFLFDEADLKNGGRYLGQFRVEKSEFRDNHHVLTVTETAARDGYDTRVLQGDHPAVTVYEDLPVDRWLAFYRTGGEQAAAATGIAPEPVKVAAETVTDILSADMPPDDESAAELKRLVEAFVETFTQHEKPVSEESWDDTAAKLAAGGVPHGTYWAEVEFTADHAFTEGSEDAKRDYVAGERAEFDLGTALTLRDELGKATIVGMVYRRPLIDAVTLLHGGIVSATGSAEDGGDGVRTDGAAALIRALRQEKADLQAATARLEQTLASLAGTTAVTTAVAGELTADLEQWQRDVAAAERLTGRFEDAVSRTTIERQAAEERGVALGQELVRVNATLTAEIDRVAPAPTGQ